MNIRTRARLLHGALPLVALAVSMASMPCVGQTQDSTGQKASRSPQSPQCTNSIIIPCDSFTILGQGNGVPVKVTFVLSDHNSACGTVLDCPDVTPNPPYAFPPGEGPYVFGCGNGRIRASGAGGSGNFLLNICGAD